MLHPVQINIKLSKKPADILQGYCLYYIDEEFDENDNPLIIQKIQESKIIIINILDDDKEELFVGFNKTIFMQFNRKYFNKKPEINFLQTITQYELGLIYYEGELVARDINKSIYYYTLSSNQNDQYSRETWIYLLYRTIC